MNIIKDENRVAVSVKEFCKIAGISEPTARRRIADGTIETVRLGGRVLVKTTFINKLFGIKESESTEAKE